MLPLCPIILIIEILKINQIFMRRLITLFFLVFTLSGVSFAPQMSDDQVVQYVKSAQQMGKNQKQITTELMRRGVTKEQVERIQKKYENSKSGSPQSNTQDEKRSRQRGEMSGVVKGCVQPRKLILPDKRMLQGILYK